MASGLACRICSGDVTLRIRGRGAPLTAAALSPSAHGTGLHGDLLVRRDCGTVQQPALPAGADLHDLYRDMTDEAYLGEEEGRRATAGRLLDLIAPFVPRGRLLDVGCGPGLRSTCRRPFSGGSCGSRPSPTTSWTVIANGNWASSGTTAIDRATVLRSSAADRDAAERGVPDRAARGRRSGPAGSVDLPGAVRADEGDPLAGAERQVASATIRRSPYATVTASAARIGRSQLVPRAGLGEQDQEERRADDGHHDADREVAERARDEVGRRQQERPEDRGERDDAVARSGRRAAGRRAARPARRSRSGR